MQSQPPPLLLNANRPLTWTLRFLDQIRFVRYFETTRVFIYIGGFLDPLLKNAITKNGEKIYLSGVGYGWQSVYLAVSAGIEYPDIAVKNTRLAFSLGYEIPLGDVLE